MKLLNDVYSRLSKPRYNTWHIFVLLSYFIATVILDRQVTFIEFFMFVTLWFIGCSLADKTAKIV